MSKYLHWYPNNIYIDLGFDTSRWGVPLRLDWHPRDGDFDIGVLCFNLGVDWSIWLMAKVMAKVIAKQASLIQKVDDGG